MSDTTFPAFASSRRLPNLFDHGGDRLRLRRDLRRRLRSRAARCSRSTRPERDHDLARSREPADLRACAPRCACSRRCSARCSSPSPTPPSRRRAGAPALILIPIARHPAIGADPRLPLLHRHLLHEPLPRPRAGRGARLDLRDLHQPGLEHGVLHVPVAAHRAGRSRRGRARLPPHRTGSASGGSKCRSPCRASCGTR